MELFYNYPQFSPLFTFSFKSPLFSSILFVELDTWRRYITARGKGREEKDKTPSEEEANYGGDSRGDSEDNTEDEQDEKDARKAARRQGRLKIWRLQPVTNHPLKPQPKITYLEP